MVEKRLVYAVCSLALGLCMITGCSIKNDPVMEQGFDEENKTKTEETVSEDDSSEIEMVSDDPSEVEPFVFRDVFGEEYETTIDPDIAPKTYSDDAWVREGDKLSYYDFAVWQYSNEGSVSGISGACDLDIWIGSPMLDSEALGL